MHLSQFKRLVPAIAAAALAFQSAGAQTPAQRTAPSTRAANADRVPILEYHLIADHDSPWGRSWQHFQADLELLYERGYRPITVAQFVDGKFDIPAGTSPVVFTFDDASPSQFRYIERDGKLEIDSTSGVGIWLAFHAKHPDWGNRATFCMLPAASHGHAFFGDRGVEGQKTSWRMLKLKFLAEQGFELCDHTLWHANLAKYSDAVVQEQIARGMMAIDSAVPGYRVRTFALPYGVWPKNQALAQKGSWTDPKTGKVYSYDFDAILEVAGSASPMPGSPEFNALHLQRIQMNGDDLKRALDLLDRTKTRYIAGPMADSATPSSKTGRL